MAAIRKQIEFYFSDSNFRKDTFLRAASESDPEGFVPIATLLTFNKLKALTTDVAEIVKAVEGSEVVTVSEDGLKIRRTSELPATDNSKECTIYVKGYPTDTDEVTIDSVREQFSPYGEVALVRLRREPASRTFKGSVFVEFKEKDSALAALAAAHNAEGAVTLTYKDKPFDCVMSLQDWVERRNAKKKGNKNNSETTPEETSGKRKADEIEEDNYTPGLIIKVEGVPAEATLFQLKDALKAHGDVKYVDFTAGETSATVRTADETSTKAVMDAIEKGITVLPETPVITATLLTGEEESNYWKIIAAASKAGAGKRGHKGGRGGRGRGRGNKRARNA